MYYSVITVSVYQCISCVSIGDMIVVFTHIHMIIHTCINYTMIYYNSDRCRFTIYGTVLPSCVYSVLTFPLLGTRYTGWRVKQCSPESWFDDVIRLRKSPILESMIIIRWNYNELHTTYHTYYTLPCVSHVILVARVDVTPCWRSPGPQAAMAVGVFVLP